MYSRYMRGIYNRDACFWTDGGIHISNDVGVYSNEKATNDVQMTYR